MYLIYISLKQLWNYMYCELNWIELKLLNVRILFNKTIPLCIVRRVLMPCLDWPNKCFLTQNLTWSFYFFNITEKLVTEKRWWDTTMTRHIIVGQSPLSSAWFDNTYAILKDTTMETNYSRYATRQVCIDIKIQVNGLLVASCGTKIF